jgi:transposase
MNPSANELLDIVTSHGEVVNTDKAARLLGYSQRTIVRWCKQGKLEGAENFGRDTMWLIPLASLRKYRLLKDP